MPTNNALMGMDAGAPSPQTRALIVKWGKLHAVRSALGSLATIAFCQAAFQPETLLSLGSM